MKSLTELYRIGLGPSSSHTMGPRFAAQAFAADLPEACARVRVTLYCSLAATGRGVVAVELVANKPDFLGLSPCEPKASPVDNQPNS